MTLKLMSYNIRFGGREREGRLAEVIRAASPDIVVFQEASDPHVIEALSAATAMPRWAARPSYSIGYISRLPLERHEWHHPEGARHAFMELVLEGGHARIFGLHLKARFSKWSEQRRVLEIKALLEGIRQHQEGFHLLVGDFNTLAPGELLDVKRMPRWIRALVWISGRDIKRDTVRAVTEAGYVDGYRYLHPEEKGYTFPTWDPHLRLDYLFTPRRYADRIKSCKVITAPDPASSASDHFPLLAEIEL